MEFEWDENKRVSNIQKHGLDFARINKILSKAHVTLDARSKDGEQRYLTIGKVDDKFVTVVYTLRGQRYRIISIRRARGAEKRKYQEVHGE